MPRNGSGTFNLYTPGNPVVSGTTIASTWANNTLDDIAVALTGSVAADGQTPMTGNLDMNGFSILLDVDGDTYIYSSADDQIDFGINGADAMILTGSALSPDVNDGLALGTTSLGWADLHGATGFTLNIANGNWLATHTSGILTVGTGDLRVTTAGTNTASAVTVGGTQTLSNKTIPVGGSASTGSFVGVSHTDTTTVGNVGGGTDNLMSYTIPASFFSSNGKAVEIIAQGATANNANAKTLGFVFGSGTPITWSMTANQSGRWVFHALIVRSGSNTQVGFTNLQEGTTTLAAGKVANNNVNETQTESGTIVIQFTGAATSNDDITQRLLTVRFHNL